MEKHQDKYIFHVHLVPAVTFSLIKMFSIGLKTFLDGLLSDWIRTNEPHFYINLVPPICMVPPT